MLILLPALGIDIVMVVIASRVTRKNTRRHLEFSWFLTPYAKCV